jgi:hypothetical protein
MIISMTQPTEAAVDSPETAAYTKIDTWQTRYRACIQSPGAPTVAELLTLSAAASIVMHDLVVLIAGAAALPRRGQPYPPARDAFTPPQPRNGDSPAGEGQ